MGYHGVDFDGTLAVIDDRDPVVGPLVPLGRPVPAMLARVLKWLAAGEEVRIITARVAPTSPNGAEDYLRIQDWCEHHLGQVLPVQAHKCFGMIDLYDDRAVKVEMNTGWVAKGSTDSDPLTSLEQIELDEGTRDPRTMEYTGT